MMMLLAGRCLWLENLKILPHHQLVEVLLWWRRRRMVMGEILQELGLVGNWMDSQFQK